jgi:hypothetical protein
MNSPAARCPILMGLSQVRKFVNCAWADNSRTLCTNPKMLTTGGGEINWATTAKLHIMRDQLRELAAFATVAEERSFTRAAGKGGSLMKVFDDPFFWALVSMFGLIGAEAVVGSDRLAKSRSLGVLSVGMFGLGRVVLVLPAVSQPRFTADWTM